MNCFNDFDAYICPSLDLPPTKAAVGYLLKNWEDIPGRDSSPNSDVVSEISEETCAESKSNKDLELSCVESDEILENQASFSLKQNENVNLDAQTNSIVETGYKDDFILNEEVEKSFEACGTDQTETETIYESGKLVSSTFTIQKCVSPDLFDSDHDTEDFTTPVKLASKHTNGTKDGLSKSVLDSPEGSNDIPPDNMSGTKKSPTISRYFETRSQNFKISSVGSKVVRCKLYNKELSSDPPKVSSNSLVSQGNSSKCCNSETIGEELQESKDTLDTSIHNISATKCVIQEETADVALSSVELPRSVRNLDDLDDLCNTESLKASTMLPGPLTLNKSSCYVNEDSFEALNIPSLVLSNRQSPTGSSNLKISNINISDENLTMDITIPSAECFVTKRRTKFTKFYSSEMLDMDLSDSEMPNSCINLSGQSKAVSNDLVGLTQMNNSNQLNDLTIDLSQTDSNDSESTSCGVQNDNLSLNDKDLCKMPDTISEQDKNVPNVDDGIIKQDGEQEALVDLTQSSDENAGGSEDITKEHILATEEPECEQKCDNSARQSFGTKTFSRDSGNASCEFSSTKSLNVTDYVLGILNMEYDVPTENIAKGSKDLPDAEYFSQSQSTCSQESIVVLSDEELNYSSKFSAQHQKDFYNLTNFDDECINHKVESEDIEAVHLELKNKYCQENNIEEDEIMSEKFHHDVLDPIEPLNSDTQKQQSKQEVLLTNKNIEYVTSSKTDDYSNVATPERHSKLNHNPSSNVNTTPNENIIIKTNNITPMANYDAMDSPQIRSALDKFGIKPLKRRRGIQLLKYIYETTHPFVQDENVEVADEEVQRQNKRRKLSDKFEKTGSINIVGSALIESELESDLLFERKFTKTIKSCRIPLQIAWYNFLCCNSALAESIVLYEPIQLEVIHSMLKEQSGCNFHVEDFITFLDKKCITFRTNQWQGSRKKVKEKS